MKMPQTPKPTAASSMTTSKAKSAEGASATPPVVAQGNAAKSAAPTMTQPAGSSFKAPGAPSMSRSMPQAMTKRLDKTP